MSVVFDELRRRVRRTVTFEACLPRRAKEPPSGPDWIHEIKHDGFRILAQKDSAGVRLITPNGYDFAERYPLIVEAISSLKVSSIVVDGEAMCFTGAMHDFDKLWNRTHDHEAKLCAFDLLNSTAKELARRSLDCTSQWIPSCNHRTTIACRANASVSATRFLRRRWSAGARR